MPSLAKVKASNASHSHAERTPVAVFVGGTSGVGEAMVQLMSRYTSGNVDLVIVGRNRAAAEKTFSSLPRPISVDGTPVRRDFISCDAFLMKNIIVACQELKSTLRKINYLVLSAGYMKFTNRDETEEGIDKMLGMRYYCRFKYTKELMPLLESARALGEDAAVLSILAPAMVGFKVPLEDLGLKTSYSTLRCLTSASLYNDIMVEEFSKRHPDISFTHIHPGFVDTPAMDYLYESFFMRVLRPVVSLAIYLGAVSSEQSAENMLYALWANKKGWYRKNATGDDMSPKSHPDEVKHAVWEHSCSVTDT